MQPQLQQMMLNLILNAVEAMSGSDEGSRELLISTQADGANGVRLTEPKAGAQPWPRERVLMP